MKLHSVYVEGLEDIVQALKDQPNGLILKDESSEAAVVVLKADSYRLLSSLASLAYTPEFMLSILKKHEKYQKGELKMLTLDEDQLSTI